jgi:hypothetical protein
MAIDNSLHYSLESTHFKIKDYLDKVTLVREHSPMIIKNEELAELLETFDIEALEEQTKDIQALHEQLNAIKKVSTKIVEALIVSSDATTTAAKVTACLDEIFLKISNIVL